MASLDEVGVGVAYAVGEQMLPMVGGIGGSSRGKGDDRCFILRMPHHRFPRSDGGR